MGSMMPGTTVQQTEIAILDDSTAQASNPVQILTAPPSPGEFGRALKKVLDDACCENLWRSESFFYCKTLFESLDIIV